MTGGVTSPPEGTGPSRAATRAATSMLAHRGHTGGCEARSGVEEDPVELRVGAVAVLAGDVGGKEDRGGVALPREARREGRAGSGDEEEVAHVRDGRGRASLPLPGARPSRRAGLPSRPSATRKVARDVREDRSRLLRREDASRHRSGPVEDDERRAARDEDVGRRVRARRSVLPARRSVLIHPCRRISSAG